MNQNQNSWEQKFNELGFTKNDWEKGDLYAKLVDKEVHLYRDTFYKVSLLGIAKSPEELELLLEKESEL